MTPTCSGDAPSSDIIPLVTTKPSPSAVPSAARDVTPGDSRRRRIRSARRSRMSRAPHVSPQTRNPRRDTAPSVSRRRGNGGPAGRRQMQDVGGLLGGTLPCFSNQSCTAKRAAPVSAGQAGKMIGPEAHAELAQRAALILRERLDLGGDAAALENAHASATWKAMPRAAPVMPSGSSRSSRGPQCLRIAAVIQASSRACT